MATKKKDETVVDVVEEEVVIVAEPTTPEEIADATGFPLHTIKETREGPQGETIIEVNRPEDEVNAEGEPEPSFITTGVEAGVEE